MAVLQKTTVPGLNDAQWRKIAEALSDTELGFTSRVLGNQAGIPYRVALGILLRLGDERIGKLQWLIHHGCSEHPVKAVPFAKGMPSTPRRCPECELPADPEEFSFDVECLLNESVVPV